MSFIWNNSLIFKKNSWIKLLSNFNISRKGTEVISFPNHFLIVTYFPRLIINYYALNTVLTLLFYKCLLEDISLSIIDFLFCMCSCSVSCPFKIIHIYKDRWYIFMANTDNSIFLCETVIYLKYTDIKKI